MDYLGVDLIDRNKTSIAEKGWGKNGYNSKTNENKKGGISISY